MQELRGLRTHLNENLRLHFLLVRQRYYNIVDNLTHHVEKAVDVKEGIIQMSKELLEAKEAQLVSKEGQLVSKEAQLISKEAEVKHIVEGNRTCLSVYEKMTNTLENQVADLKIE